MLFACNTNTNTTATAVNEISADTAYDIPFTTAKNYFLKNTFKADSLVNSKITNQENFDSIFGMATVMGDQGKPTSIDFSKQYVIAIVKPVTDKATALAVESLVKKDNSIILKYRKTEGEKQSFTTRPILLVIVDNAYNGNVEVHQQ